MFLKRLETIGFKSFAERITIEFVPGITTIVGPNGSGKSNVIDAIRWVLGEQSARALRGKRMEDVIFQGSETRNPLNFAEVSLVLNNEAGQLPIEYQEVKVTRRVYRSGESEFLINKQPCRLKDIVDLFTDTGLGRESFSIVGQGKIDEILSSKAEERRAVFEEAAGVMRYKRRKEEATYKLQETEDNLSRVEDIIHEISQQIEPLKAQAEVAKRYQDLEKELAEKEISLFVTEISQLYIRWQALLEEIDRDSMKLLEEETEVQAFEARLLQRREEVEALESKIQSLHARLVDITEKVEQTEAKRQLHLEQTKHREENKQTLTAEKASLLRALEALEERIKKESHQVKHTQLVLTSLQEEIREVESSLYSRQDQLVEQIESLKSDLIEYLNEQAVLHNENRALTERLRRIDARLHSEKERKDTYQSEFDALKEKSESLHEELRKKAAQVSEYKNRKSEIEGKLLEEEERLARMQAELYRLQEQRTKYRSRQEVLEEMKMNFQGFAYGVKEILQAKQRGELNGVIGPVIDLIEVPERFIQAIDTILGQQAQFVVVPDDATARQVIAWLKRENKGRATFLPLKSIIPRTLPAQVQQLVSREPGFIGIANDLVDVEPGYRKVVDHLMGNVIVTENLITANQIAAKTNRRYRIVTLEGDVVFPGGSISGGAQRKRQGSLFSREREWQQLKERITQIEQALSKGLREKEGREGQLLQGRQEVEQLTSSLESLERECEALTRQVQQLDFTLESLQGQLTGFAYQEQEYEEEAVRVKEGLKENTQRLTSLTEQIDGTKQRIESMTEEREKLLENKTKNEKRLHELQIKRTEQQERAKYFEETLHGLAEEKSRLQEKFREITEQLKEIAKVEEQMEHIEEIEATLQNYRDKRVSIQREITDLQEKRKSSLQAIEDGNRELDGRRKILNEAKQVLQDKEVEAGRLDVQLENRLQTLQERYTITFEKAEKTYPKVEDIEAQEKKVQHLRQKIRALGTVNLGAIEEYERLKERESFLNRQREDLLEAKDTLYEAIERMDKEMITRFKRTFESIQEAFTEVFSQLFGGGHAELVLTNPDNYLETGIDIVARPPGKKLKTLELLSGGERALTAIALLFAILRARSVPFVILDEVDAALDEANVDRFASYLKRFSEESQFVVISHRKGTMEKADALYGVTMQESGVSRFVSVRLEEADDLVQSS